MKAKSLASSAPVKRKVEDAVAAYRRFSLGEYVDLCTHVRMRRELAADKFASADGATDMRALYEISESLNQMIVAALSEDEARWLRSVEGGRWFAAKFKEFALPEYV